jgi:hypothetical protein
MQTGTTAYLSLSDPKYDTVSAMVQESYPNACILWVEAVNNPVLEERYQKYKSTLVPQEAVQELLLFHGTKEHNINSIITQGFNHSLNVTSAYGKGTYFAKHADYSKNYSHGRTHDDISYMFICKIACANGCLGKSYTKIKSEYDYAVDNMTSPRIYVIPHDEAAVPVYVVAFYKNAS